MHSAILVALDPAAVAARGLGNALAEALAPFERGPEDGRFLEFVDKTSMYQEWWREMEPEARAKYGSFRDFMISDGMQVRRVDGQERIGREENPNGKWDWYQLGGRWSGFFRPKDGEVGTLGEKSLLREDEVASGCFDAVRKNQLDLEGIRAEGRAAAKKFYAEYVQLLQGTEKIDTLKSVYGPRGMAFDLELLHVDQSGAYVVQENEVALPWKDLWMSHAPERAHWRDIYRTFASEEAFLAEYEASFDKTIPYGILDLQGVWHDRRRKGAVDLEHKIWAAEFTKLFDALPDDTVLALVDIHN